MLRSSVEAASSVWQKLEHEHHNDLKRDGGFYLTCLSHHLESLSASLGDLDRMVRLIADDEALQIVDLQLLIERLATELTVAHPDLSFSVRHTDLPKIKLPLRKITAVLYDVLATGIQAAGDREVEVTVAASVENGNCVMWIRDNGPGLTRKQQRRIFRMRRTGVTGGGSRAADLSTGLLQAREVLSSINGHLELESCPGKGTIIKIVVPLR
jgi:signal transduction histidine kinase